VDAQDLDGGDVGDSVFLAQEYLPIGSKDNTIRGVPDHDGGRRK
jgi:hypothetical protein